MKLHIGCGEKYLPGYKHLDARPYPHVDYVGKADDLSRFANGTITEIYACHILEHFPRHAILNVLKEWNRVLIPNGTLRIAVPDFEAIVKEYQANKDLDKVLGLLYGGQNYEYNYHYQAYDFERIKRLLTEAGFIGVSYYDWHTFLPDGYDDFSRAYLPHMDFQNGRLMSLNVIATKRREEKRREEKRREEKILT